MFPYLKFIQSNWQARKANHFTRAELQQFQLERLRKIVQFAFQKSPFYRSLYLKHGLKETQLKKIQVQDLPTVNKSLLMSNFDQVVTDKLLKYDQLKHYIAQEPALSHNYLGKYKILHTSGTSGVVGIFPIALTEMAEVLAAISQRISPIAIHHLFRKKKLAYFAATHGKFIGATYLDFLPKLATKTKLFSILAPLKEVVEGLNSFQPDDLVGYSSAMEILAEQQLAGRLKISPQNIACSGDPLFPGRRQKILQAFGINPVNSYSMTEGMAVANHLQGGKTLSVFDDLYLLEAQPATIISNLYNYTFPLIRYQNEDLVQIVPDSAQLFTQIAELQGRMIDLLPIINNHQEPDSIHPIVLAEFYAEGLTKFQFWSEAPDAILIKIIGTGENLEKDVQNAFIQILKEKKADQSTRFRIERVTEIPVNPKTGKFKLVNFLNQ